MHLVTTIGGRARLAGGAGLLALVTACSAPVAGGLDDGEANRVVVSLDRAGVDSTKEPDPGVDGKWRVTVGRDDVPQALEAMRDDGLPRARPPGVLDAVGKGALVPSEAAEHAQLVAGIAGDLERSLEGIDGVLSARVHLSLPLPSPLRDEAPAARGSASVLLEHSGPTPPLSADSIQHLVAGGVAGLAPADVTVVLVSRPAPPSTSSSGMSHVGPIAVARNSLRLAQGAIGGLVALVAMLMAAWIVLYARFARLRSEQASAAHSRAPAAAREPS